MTISASLQLELYTKTVLGVTGGHFLAYLSYGALLFVKFNRTKLALMQEHVKGHLPVPHVM